MTSTGTYQGLKKETRNSSKVLKPPGGGSSDIFAPPANEDASPRRGRHRGQSQLGTALFGSCEASPPTGSTSSSSSNMHSTAATVSTVPIVSSASLAAGNSNGSKSGNDSHNRLFGPPDAPAHTHSSINKNHASRSNIYLGSDGANGGGIIVNGDNIVGIVSDGTGGSSCMPRNPVTGDGVDLTPIRRSTRKCRDGNPVTGTGYGRSMTDSPSSAGSSPAAMTAPNAGSHHSATASSLQNGKSSNSTSSVDSSPASASGRPQARTRVPPGGYSSGLW